MQDLDRTSVPSAELPGPGLAIALRHATAEAHAAIERLPMMSRLTSSAVTREDYLQYLRTFASIYAPLEQQLYDGLDEDLRQTLGVSPKLPALRHDLEEQGDLWPQSAPGDEADTALPQEDVAAIVGGLYVLEGATLGGRTIARHLRRALGGELGAARFLDFHRERTSPHWKRFSAALDRLAEHGVLPPERVIAGALAVFAHVHHCVARAASDTNRE